MNDNLPVKIVETPLYPVMIKAYCKKCGEELVRSNEVLLSCPPQYQYRCKCGVNFHSREEFPRLEYKPLKGEEPHENDAE